MHQFKYKISRTGEAIITDCIGNDEKLVIPSEIDGHLVKRINNNIFGSFSEFALIEIPHSVIMLDTKAFCNCNNLKSISVSADNTVYSSANGLLLNKNETCLLYCPIGRTEVLVPSSILSIATTTTLDDCNKLKTINVEPDNENFSSEDGVLFDKNKTILYYLPKENSEKYTVPDSVTLISSQALINHSKLESINIGPSDPPPLKWWLP